MGREQEGLLTILYSTVQFCTVYGCIAPGWVHGTGTGNSCHVAFQFHSELFTCVALFCAAASWACFCLTRIRAPTRAFPSRPAVRTSPSQRWRESLRPRQNAAHDSWFSIRMVTSECSQAGCEECEESQAIGTAIGDHGQGRRGPGVEVMWQGNTVTRLPRLQTKRPHNFPSVAVDLRLLEAWCWQLRKLRFHFHRPRSALPYSSRGFSAIMSHLICAGAQRTPAESHSAVTEDRVLGQALCTRADHVVVVLYI